MISENKGGKRDSVPRSRLWRFTDSPLKEAASRNKTIDPHKNRA